MLPTEDLFVYVYVLIDDAIKARAIVIPARPGRRPAAPTRRSWRSPRCACCWAAAARPGSSPRWPATGRTCSRYCRTKARLNRRARWLWGAFEQFRAALAARLPEDDCQQIDTSALPVKHASRVRGPDGWTGPNGLHARFGRDAAHAEWFYGFRLAAKTDLGSRIVRAWSIVPAAVSERDVGTDLLEAGPPPREPARGQGVQRQGVRRVPGCPQHRSAGPAHQGPAQDLHIQAILQKVIAQWRNRIETTFKEITDQMELARHGAHTFWGLLARTAATIAAHTLMRACLAAP